MSGRRTSASWCRWTAVFIRGLKSARRESCLLTLVDDATGQTLGRFGAQETIWAAVGVLRAWIERYGIPQALYTDWKNVYVRPPNAEERVTGAEPLTQFGRMCATLGIQHHSRELAAGEGADRAQSRHAAGSPGEEAPAARASRTSRRRIRFSRPSIGRTTIARFAQPPASSDDFHVARPRGMRLDAVFRLEEARTVSNDWVVRYDNRFLQLERQSRLAPARSTVQVYEDVRRPDRDSVSRPRDAVDGDRRRPARTRAAPATAGRPRPTAAPRDSRRRAVRRSSVASRRRRSIAVARQLAADRRAWRRCSREAACGSCRSRGRPERAHRSLENHRTVFHSSHRHRVFTGRGHF